MRRSLLSLKIIEHSIVGAQNWSIMNTLRYVRRVDSFSDEEEVDLIAYRNEHNVHVISCTSSTDIHFVGSSATKAAVVKKR